MSWPLWWVDVSLVSVAVVDVTSDCDTAEAAEAHDAETTVAPAER